MNVTERLWEVFLEEAGTDNIQAIVMYPNIWTYCGRPLSKYLERTEWIDENIVGGVDFILSKDDVNDVFVFVDNVDAMAFKLRWL